MKTLNELKILLVDDQEQIRTAIRMVMESKKIGQSIDEASCGPSAIEMTQECQYDLVLMDISLPGMNGIEATREVLNQCTNTKVIGVSMHTNEDHITEMAEAGASGYILKDNLVKEIDSALRNVMAGKHFFSVFQYR